MLSSPLPSSLEDILEELTAITARAKEIEARRQELLDALDQLVEEGQADERITWNDFTISRASRESWIYSSEFEAKRKAIKESLATEEGLERAFGKAERVVKTFWTVRLPKP